MKKLFILFLFSFTNGFSQNISGFVNDAGTGEHLSGVVVRLGNSGIQTATNAYGFFSISLNKYPASLTFSMVGYNSVIQYLNAPPSKPLNIALKIADYRLKEIVVKAEPQKISETPIGMTHISVARLKAVPALLGEKDILKSLALTPGVSNSVEGTTGLIVRGGGTDQNLIMIDETPVYNVSHLFGLVSVFNPDAVKDVNLYKSSFPAKYGGRLSSVIDITGKEGNSKAKNTELTVGLINSRLLFEGPLKKDKNLTYLLAGRFTNLFLVTIPTFINYKRGNENSYLSYTMIDLNAKISKRFQDNSQLYLSLFTGTDKYGFRSREDDDNSGRARLNWGSVTGSVRYTRPLTQKLFLKSTIAYTRYRYGTEFSSYFKKKETDYLDTKTFLGDFILKSGLE